MKLEDEFINAHEVATAVKLDYRTILRLARENKIPHVKIGYAVRFSRSDIDQWLNQQGMEPTLEKCPYCQDTWHTQGTISACPNNPDREKIAV